MAEWYWRKLPSHVVIFTSEETKSVRAFLAGENRCTRIADFFHELIQGDVHAKRARGRVAVWYCPQSRDVERVKNK